MGRCQFIRWVAERDNSPTQGYLRPQSTDFSGLSGSPTICSPLPDGVASLDRLFPAIATAGRAW